MSLTLRSTILRSLLLAASVAGCNSILDNKPATLQERVTPTVEQNQPTDGGAKTPADDTPPPAVNTEPVKEPTPVTPTGCEQGTHQCGGTCAGNNDPSYGCGAESCKACQIPHGTPGCAGTACAVGKCAKGYADCNGNPADGCETDLSKPETCGACNAVCPTAAPLCAPAGDSFQCGGGCPAAAPVRCGNECMLSLTTVNHCGACDTKCPDVPNATAKCSALGQCGFTCEATFHACGGACKRDSDPAACGETCAVCPTPPNADATCTADKCGFTCKAGFHECNNACVSDTDPAACGATCTACSAGPNMTAACTANKCAANCAENFADCDGNPANGCETALQTDALNCGTCATSCNGGTCTSGRCSAAPGPDAGAPPP